MLSAPEETEVLGIATHP